MPRASPIKLRARPKWGRKNRVKATVLLFDIDGTLVSTGGAGRRALERAFGAEHGRPDALAHIRLDGMTDPAIVRAGLSHIQVPFSTIALDALLARYLEFLEDEVAQVPPARYRTHEGMRAALDQISGRPQVAVGLGTGNVRAGARIKLRRAALDGFFSFGGFGCDAEGRPELIRRGAERGASQLGIPLGDCRVVVIGDTPNDVSAAHTVGAECVGVGTGSFRPEELRACGAKHAFPDLGAPGALEALLGEET
jgi:phosphoglycolate phosphatase-like HAD superfamily hydrolase